MTLQNLSPRNEECSPQGNGLLCMLPAFCPPEMRGLCTQPKKEALEQVVSRVPLATPPPAMALPSPTRVVGVQKL